MADTFDARDSNAMSVPRRRIKQTRTRTEHSTTNTGAAQELYHDFESQRMTSGKRKVYYRAPGDWYLYEPGRRRSGSLLFRQESLFRNMNESELSPRTIAFDYDPLFTSRSTPGKGWRKKGMIVGEKRRHIHREPILSEPKDLPRDLYLSNFHEHTVDWEKYKDVTWNDLLHAHKRELEEDIRRLPNNAQHKQMPILYDPLFQNKTPRQRQYHHPYVEKHILMRTKQGDIYSLEGPSKLFVNENNWLAKNKPKHRHEHRLPSILNF
ncbi:hypothetical protein ACJMK2_029532 [Sinanodonta woodiana]|uniref:Uncharacterized protein n=1 Tax=Sinanodonta woodiana TaxID=1069815 RepID=A0ABD3XAF5_SINWO